MSDKRIRQLAAGSALASTDVLPVDNNSLVEARKFSMSQIAGFLIGLMRQKFGQAVNPGANTINLPASLSASTYEVFYTYITSGGDLSWGAVSGKTVNSFTFTCDKAGTITGIAIL